MANSLADRIKIGLAICNSPYRDPGWDRALWAVTEIMVAVAGGGMTEGGGAAVVGGTIGDTMRTVIVLVEQPVAEPRTVAGDMRVVVVKAVVEASGEFYEGS